MNKQELLKLRGAAHSLKPTVITGSNGLTEAVHQEIDLALESHELIKVRINAEDRDQRKEFITEICEHHNATLVQTIGHIIAIYRASNK